MRLKRMPRNENSSFQSIIHKHKKQKPLCKMIFFHPDYTVGFGITPNHALRLVGFTTGRELHPALKISYSFLFTR